MCAGSVSEPLMHPSCIATSQGYFQPVEQHLEQPEGHFEQPQGRHQQHQGHFQSPEGHNQRLQGHLQQAVPASPPHRWLRAELDSARVRQQAEQRMHMSEEAVPSGNASLQPSRVSKHNTVQQHVSQSHQQQQQQQTLGAEAVRPSVSVKPGFAGLTPGHLPSAAGAVPGVRSDHQPQVEPTTVFRSPVVQPPLVGVQSHQGSGWQQPQRIEMGTQRATQHQAGVYASPQPLDTQQHHAAAHTGQQQLQQQHQQDTVCDELLQQQQACAMTHHPTHAGNLP